jgi:ankyrin repeat protein
MVTQSRRTVLALLLVLVVAFFVAYEASGLRIRVTRRITFPTVDTSLRDAIDSGDPDAVSRAIQANPALVHQQLNGTPLHWAAWDNKADICELLLNAGADVDARVGQPDVAGAGETPIFFAIEKHNTGVVKVLLAHHANLSLVNSYGQTPLAVAQEYRFTDIIDLLTSADAPAGAR